MVKGSDMEQKRIILHCDCNSFFASVETVLDPSLRNIPMAVGGNEENRHGIILAKNELAKAYGIVTAETIWSAKRKCPNLTVVLPHYGEYVRYSRAVGEIYRRFTDRIEPFGIDESWLDVTGSTKLFGSGFEIAEKIRNAVKQEIGITVSIGVSFNKVFAKLGSDYKKPDAVTVIDENNYKKIVFPLPVDSMIFVGKRTADELKRFNIYTLGELAASSRAFLVSRFGKIGGTMHDYANGRDTSPVASIYDADTPPKSVGNGMTFKHDLVTSDEIHIGLLTLSEEIAERLRRYGLCAAAISITVKGIDLKSVSRQMQISPATAIGREIERYAYRLLLDVWSIGKPIRALTVTAQEVIQREHVTEQISFFENGEKHWKKIGRIEATVDEIRKKYGRSSLVSGAVIDNDLGIDIGKQKPLPEVGENGDRKK